MMHNISILLRFKWCSCTFKWNITLRNKLHLCVNKLLGNLNVNISTGEFKNPLTVNVSNNKKASKQLFFPLKQMIKESKQLPEWFFFKYYVIIKCSWNVHKQNTLANETCSLEEKIIFFSQFFNTHFLLK